MSDVSDDEQHNQIFEQPNIRASATFPMICSSLRKNGHVVINGRPCKILEICNDNNEVIIVGIDIFTGKKLNDKCPLNCNMDVPNVTRNEYQLVNIDDDGFLNLMTQDGTPKDDVRIPGGDIGKQINDCFFERKDLLVTIISSMGEESCIFFKEAPEGS